MSSEQDVASHAQPPLDDSHRAASGHLDDQLPAQWPSTVDDASCYAQFNDRAAVLSLTENRQQALTAASAAVADGKCIVMPTDTVYGIGAAAFNARAVQRLLDVKRRGRDMPPPVLIADPELLPALVAGVSESARALVNAFWPGALTLIFNAQTGMQLDLGETGGTIAVRVPDHELTRELLRATGPLAVSSANLSGQPAATEVQAAVSQLGAGVEVYLDGGSTPGNVPSTIVDFSQHATGKVVRRGVISFEQLVEKAPFVEDLPVIPEA